MRLIDGDELYREYQSVVCHDIACAECKAVDKDTGECRVDYLISDAPTIDAVSVEWIPCEERLPSEDGKYLIVGRQGAVNILPYRDGRWYGRWGVIAWMPLPKPYGEREGE